MIKNFLSSKWNKFIYPFVILITFNSCSNKSESHAKALCNCLQEAGLKEGIDLDNFPREIDDNNTCFQEVGIEIYDHMKSMDQNQRADYLKNFIGEILETECADIIFEMLPYDEMLENLERTMNRRDLSEGGISFEMEGSISVCECIKFSDQMMEEIDDANDNTEIMNKIEEKYSKRIEECKKMAEGLSEEEKKKLIEEAENCK